MVIGNGLIAKQFLPNYKDSREVLIFASGVSNSKCVEMKEYAREYDLVAESLNKYPNFHFVYFSTCSIYDPVEANSEYVFHKKKIEKLISDNSKSFHIFRVSNLVGKSENKNTILNFFYDKIANQIPFVLWSNASRNLIDIDDMYAITNEIIKDKYKLNSNINIANPNSYSAITIVNELEFYLKKTGVKTIEEKGVAFKIDVADIKIYIEKYNIQFTSNYLQKLLQKYYPINDI